MSCRFVVSEISKLVTEGKYNAGLVAILVRAGFQTRAFEEVFISNALPYKIIGGLKFYERMEIRDLLAYIRITLNHSDNLGLERIINVPRRAMVNLGGLSLGTDLRKVSSYARGYGDHHAHHSFYHVHYYIYPLIYWLELITDFICLEQSSFDVAYISELDVVWNDEKLQTLLNPEVFLFGNHLAQAACSIDCAASTIDLPRDEMFWCAGC